MTWPKSSSSSTGRRGKRNGQSDTFMLPDVDSEGLPNAGDSTPTAPLVDGRVGRDGGRIADEVIAHLAALPGADVEVTLEVHVRVGEGVKEDVVRTVSDNATALKFKHASFEKD